MKLCVHVCMCTCVHALSLSGNSSWGLGHARQSLYYEGKAYFPSNLTFWGLFLELQIGARMNLSINNYLLKIHTLKYRIMAKAFLEQLKCSKIDYLSVNFFSDFPAMFFNFSFPLNFLSNLY